MLNPSEKAYYQALLALKNKDYKKASEQYDKAARFYENNREFDLLRETTKLLLAVKEELNRLESGTVIQVEEVFSDG